MTTESKTLTQTQLDSWQNDGFLVLENFVSTEACEILIARAAQIVEERKPEWDSAVFSTTDQEKTSNQYFLDSAEKISLFMEAEKSSGHNVNKIGHALHDLDPVFDGFSRTPALAALAAQIGFADPRLLQSMYIFKQPRTGGEVSVHQDSTFLYTEPKSCVGFWFALQEATRENGCLWALPGGHRLGLKSRFVRAADGRCSFVMLDEMPLPAGGYVPLEVPQGSLVLLHGELPHYSEPNRSTKPREAYTVHMIEGAAHYDAQNWLQRVQPARGFAPQPR